MTIDLGKLTDSIKLHEGLRLKPYVDSKGKTSIGYGRNLTDDGVSGAEADTLLSNDIQSAIRTSQAQPWWTSVANSDVRSRAFVELVFNLGVGKLAGFRQALGAAMQGDWGECAAQFRNSDWFGEVGGRAVTLTAMIETGQDPA